MSSATTCPRCGSSALADAVAGHCPCCLLRMASIPEEAPHTSSSPFESMPRQLGDYILGRQVGAGGMGVVYEAHRLTDGQRVAIKLIRESHVASPTQLRRFTIEAEAAARLDHHHIV